MKTDICNCDVKDKESLALFRDRLKKWNKWVSGQEGHSISSQIYDMVWYDTVFRTINEARRIHIERGSEETGLNGPMMDLIDRGYVASQVLSIRRLTDYNYHHPSKSVISLVRLIDDIENSIHFFTRENYVCHDGAPYDWPSNEPFSIEQRHWSYRHKNFDSFSGTAPDKRKRSDRLKTAVIKKLKKELKVCDEMRTYANRFLAHASDPESKTNLDELPKKITLNKFDECYRAITEVAWLISAITLYESGLGGVPTPQFDQLLHLDKPIVTSKNIKILHEFWTKRSSEVDEWELFNWEEKFGYESKT